MVTPSSESAHSVLQKFLTSAPRQWHLTADTESYERCEDLEITLSEVCIYEVMQYNTERKMAGKVE